MIRAPSKGLLVLILVLTCLGSVPTRAGQPPLAATYDADWSILETGPQHGFGPPSEDTYQAIRGEDARLVVKDRDRYVLDGRRLKVGWQSGPDKKATSLFIIRGCGSVIVRDLHVIQEDSDFRAFNTVRIEDCEEVLVENCTFSGTVEFHLRIEGCGAVTIRNVEIFGRDYGPDGVRCGGGIFVNNGDDKPEKYPSHPNGLFSRNPLDMRSLVIESCLFRDNMAEDKKRNLDGILIHSASNGMIFNCRFENWLAGDTALDVSHRRNDMRYVDRFFRVERNEFENCRLVKTVGASAPSNAILWCNNRYLDSPLADYHSGWDNWRVHEDHVLLKPILRFLVLWGMSGARTMLRNDLFVFREVRVFVDKGGKANPDDHLTIKSESNVFLLGRDPVWVGGKGERIHKWESWLALGNDRHSALRRLGPSPWAAQADRRLVAAAPVHIRGRMVQRDFLGKTRPPRPAVGALEP